MSVEDILCKPSDKGYIAIHYWNRKPNVLYIAECDKDWVSRDPDLGPSASGIFRLKHKPVSTPLDVIMKLENQLNEFDLVRIKSMDQFDGFEFTKDVIVSAFNKLKGGTYESDQRA